jgi:hypothetical protein
MTDVTQAATISAPTPMPSFWEDVIEIFLHPADVFRRRKDTSVWPPLLFVALTIGIITFATFNTLAPIFEAEFGRNGAAAMAKNPNITQEQMNKMRDLSVNIGKYTLPLIIAISMFVLGVVSWLVSKMFGAVTTFNQALVVAAWSYFPRILGSIAGVIQGLLMDPASLNSQLAISLSPARFMSVDTANPLVYQMLGRLDLITLWVTALLGIGFYVTGKISKRSAATFAVVMWILGSLPALRTAYMLM